MVDMPIADQMLDLLCALVIRGVEVNLNRRGDGLDVHAKQSDLTPEIKAKISANAPQVLAYLQAEQQQMQELMSGS